MESWKTVKYGSTQQTGPASAIDELVASLEEEGLAYSVEDYPVWTNTLKEVVDERKKPGTRKSRKTVEGIDLEVRDVR